MKNKLVYIAGAITDDPNYKQKFNKAAEEVRALGFDVYNPTSLPLGLTYRQYMDLSMENIAKADALLVIAGS